MGSLETELGAEQMNVMTQIPQTLRRLKKVTFRAAVQIEPFVQKRESH